MAINVYWGIEPQTKILYGEDFEYPQPRRVLDVMREHRRIETEHSYWRCPALTNILDNTFCFYSPLDTSLRLTENQERTEENPSEWVGESSGMYWGMDFHEPALIDSPVVAMLHGGVLAFADKEVTAQWTSPWFSQLQYLQYGAVCPGAFNIGAWFRPMQFEFNLWPGVREITLFKNEPMAYLQFMTDERVNLIKVDVSDEVNRVSEHCVHVPYTDPRRPLAERYDYFRTNNIKEGLLERMQAGVCPVDHGKG